MVFIALTAFTALMDFIALMALTIIPIPGSDRVNKASFRVSFCLQGGKSNYSKGGGGLVILKIVDLAKISHVDCRPKGSNYCRL